MYFDDPRSGLNDIVILEPKFITQLLSTVITTKHRFIKDGIFLHKDVEQIWRDHNKYPPNLHSTFMTLMERFEIMLNLDSKSRTDSSIDINGRSLVPSLLSDKEPAAFVTFWLPKPSEMYLYRVIRLQYIPAGLFSRLMIRMIKLATVVEVYWKNGIVLRSDKELICMKLNLKTRDLSYCVRGSQKLPVGIYIYKKRYFLIGIQI